MPRQARLDAPLALHHVMARGIERTKIFRNPDDQNDFINRLIEPCQKGDLIIYAWACVFQAIRPLIPVMIRPPIPRHSAAPFSLQHNESTGPILS
jgi:hypothetical protein